MSNLVSFYNLLCLLDFCLHLRISVSGVAHCQPLESFFRCIEVILVNVLCIHVQLSIVSNKLGDYRTILRAAVQSPQYVAFWLSILYLHHNRTWANLLAASIPNQPSLLLRLVRSVPPRCGSNQDCLMPLWAAVFICGPHSSKILSTESFVTVMICHFALFRLHVRLQPLTEVRSPRCPCIATMATYISLPTTK